MKRSLLLLLFVFATPAFAITIKNLDLTEIDDDRIELAGPVWDGSKAGPVLVGTFESKFDRKVAGKLAGGFRNAMISSYEIILVGAQQILARLNREHFQAPALPAMEARLAGLKQIDDRGETELHAIGLSGVRGASAALASRLESEKDENVRTSIVYALTSLGAAEHAPLLIRRYASEDPDVRYATIIALAGVGTPEAMALIREKGTKDKTVIVRKLSERIVNGQ